MICCTMYLFHMHASVSNLKDLLHFYIFQQFFSLLFLFSQDVVYMKVSIFWQIRGGRPVYPLE